MVMTDRRKLVAEAVGTFTLIFIGAGSIIATAGLLALLVVVALAHGLAIAVMVSTLGHVSGRTVQSCVDPRPVGHAQAEPHRRGDVHRRSARRSSRRGAGVAGAVPGGRHPGNEAGDPGCWPWEWGFAQGVGIEAVLTFFLMLAVFGTVLDKRGPRVGGLFIGLVLTMDIAAGGRLTGAAVNPARAFGPALVDGTWDNHLVYWIGPIIGAVVGALMYHYLFTDEEQRAAVTGIGARARSPSPDKSVATICRPYTPAARQMLVRERAARPALTLSGLLRSAACSGRHRSPVDPCPPLPRSVSSSASTAVDATAARRPTTSCAMRSPSCTVCGAAWGRQ